MPITAVKVATSPKTVNLRAAHESYSTSGFGSRVHIQGIIDELLELD